jgi:hypothetical protein
MISRNHSGGFPSGVAINHSGGGPSVITENECFSSLRGISLYLASEMIVTENLVQACRQAGIRLHSDTAGTRRGIIISNNRVMNNSQNPTNTYGAIELHGTAGTYNGVSVLGNVCYDNQAEPTQKYGINIQGTIYADTIVRNNPCFGNITAPINIAAGVTGITV